MGLTRDNGDFVRTMKPAADSLFLCPRCREPLTIGSPRCLCGFAVHDSNGIIDLMTKEEIAGVEPFVKAYEQVRRDEAWGGDDLNLPFRPKRHLDIWDIRRRSFRAFQSLITNLDRGVALDVGAGNCWMTRYLAEWGFEAIAVDVNTSHVDGLQAGQKFINEGARFLRVRAGIERLPFAPGRIRLLATNAAFHYAPNFRTALSEFERVLMTGGMITIIDSPFYENAADGERMLAERVVDFQGKYGMTEALARSSRYLTFNELEELAAAVKLSVDVHAVWPGVRRKYEEIRGKMFRRRIARFPLVTLTKS